MRKCLSLVILLFTIGCAGRAEQNKKSNGALPDANEATNEVMRRVSSTEDGRRNVERLGSKDVQLSQFQKNNGISERIAEAAIKEWVLTHGGNFDWNLDEVKEICLRNKRNGIPARYIPESEK